MTTFLGWAERAHQNGAVVRVGRKNVHVLLDRSGLVRSIRPNDLRVVW